MERRSCSSSNRFDELGESSRMKEMPMKLSWRRSTYAEMEEEMRELRVREAEISLQRQKELNGYNADRHHLQEELKGKELLYSLEKEKNRELRFKLEDKKDEIEKLLFQNIHKCCTECTDSKTVDMDKIHKMEQEIVELKSQLKNTKKHIDTMKASFELDMKTANDKLEDAQAKTKKTQDEKFDMNNRMIKVQNSKEEMQKSFDKLQTTILIFTILIFICKDHERRQKEKEDEIENLKMQHEVIQKEKETVEKQNECLKNYQIGLESKTKFDASQIKKLKGELETLQLENRTAQVNNEKKDKKIKNLEDELKKMKSISDTAKILIRALEEEQSKLVKESGTMASHYEKNETLIKDLKVLMSSLLTEKVRARIKDFPETNSVEKEFPSLEYAAPEALVLPANAPLVVSAREVVQTSAPVVVAVAASFSTLPAIASVADSTGVVPTSEVVQASAPVVAPVPTYTPLPAIAPPIDFTVVVPASDDVQASAPVVAAVEAAFTPLPAIASPAHFTVVVPASEVVQAPVQVSHFAPQCSTVTTNHIDVPEAPEASKVKPASEISWAPDFYTVNITPIADPNPQPAPGAPEAPEVPVSSITTPNPTVEESFKAVAPVKSERQSQIAREKAAYSLANNIEVQYANLETKNKKKKKKAPGKAAPVEVIVADSGVIEDVEKSEVVAPSEAVAPDENVAQEPVDSREIRPVTRYYISSFMKWSLIILFLLNIPVFIMILSFFTLPPIIQSFFSN